MSDEHPVQLSSGLPETVLPAVPDEWREALERALAAEASLRRAEVALVCAEHPGYLDAWAALSDLARDETEAYAYARVGYHRGLDTLRGAGWHGTGYVRWSHEENRGFLAALNALRKAAGAIGEEEEEERCALFLVQLDPDWGRRF
ncbi:MAG TPA: DUF3151 family protein [Acidimicrobiales bacterium]|nr:DUF3151 family protein [Acidimicrobiales bacterium]